MIGSFCAALTLEMNEHRAEHSHRAFSTCPHNKLSLTCLQVGSQQRHQSDRARVHTLPDLDTEGPPLDVEEPCDAQV
jgi:hypothetical protein